MTTNHRPYSEISYDLEAGYEHLAETEGQHLAETAAFGDSWPGACAQIAQIRAALGELEDEMQAHPEHTPKKARKFRVWCPSGEEPF